MTAPPTGNYDLLLTVFLYDGADTPTAHDPRIGLVSELGRVMGTCGIDARVASGEEWRSASDPVIGSSLLSRCDVEFARREESDPEVSITTRAYSRHDVLVIQVLLSGQCELDLRKSYASASRYLLDRVDPAPFEAAARDIVGVSTFYWLEGERDWGTPDVREDIGGLSPGEVAASAITDLGPLFLTTGASAVEATGFSQDGWVLLTGAEVGDCVRARFLTDDDCPFVGAAAARHKTEFELVEYEEGYARLKEQDRQLSATRRELISQQSLLSANGERDISSLREALVHADKASREFQETLSRCHDLRRTLAVGRDNFSMQAPRLLSAEGEQRVKYAQRRSKAGAAFLAESSHAELFNQTLARIEGTCGQVDTDLDYMEQSLRRHEFTRQSAQFQLQLHVQGASLGELKEMATFHGYEVAAVVATLIGTIVALLLALGEDHSLAHRRPTLVFNLVCLSVVGSFALVRLAAMLRLPKPTFDRITIALTVGFVAASFAIWVTAKSPPLLLNLAYVGLGAVIGGFIVAIAERYRTRRAEPREA